MTQFKLMSDGDVEALPEEEISEEKEKEIQKDIEEALEEIEETEAPQLSKLQLLNIQIQTDSQELQKDIDAGVSLESTTEGYLRLIQKFNRFLEAVNTDLNEVNMRNQEILKNLQSFKLKIVAN